MNKTIIGRLVEASHYTKDNRVMPLVLNYFTFLNNWPSEVILSNMERTLITGKEIEHEE